MALRRTTLILLVVLVLVIVGAVAAYMMFPDQVRQVIGGKNANTNTSVSNANTSSTPTNLSTPQDLEGDTPLTATIKIGTADVVFTSLDRLEIFDQVAAPAGQAYVVTYFTGVPAAAVNSVFDALASAQLVNGNQRYSPKTVKVASQAVKNDRGYLVFETPATAGKMTLEVGSGTEVQRVELP